MTLTAAEREARRKDGYGRWVQAHRSEDGNRLARCDAWKAVVQHEVLKLHRRGEKVPKSLLKWAKNVEA